MDAPLEKPTIYYDVYGGWLLVGDAAVDDHIQSMENGGFPAEIRPLEDVLNDNDLAIPRDGGFGNIIDWSKESPGSYISAGKWVVREAQRQKHGGQFDTDKHLFRRANRLGLFASERMIVNPKRFGGLSGLYRSIGANSKLAFNDLMPREALSYLIKTSDEFGYVPSGVALDIESQQDGDKPSHTVLMDRIGMNMTEFIREYGYWLPQDYTNDDCIQFGLNFYLSNTGHFPTKAELDDLFSPMRIGPSSFGLVQRFGSMSAYVDTVKDHLEREMNLRARALSSLSTDLKDKKFPEKLLNQRGGDEENLSRYGRFQVIKDVAPTLTEEALHELVKSGLKDAMLIQRLKELDTNINADLLSSHALRLGYHQSIWRGLNYHNSFTVENAVGMKLKSLRGSLSEEQKLIMHDTIAAGVDFLLANPHLVKDRLYWRKKHFDAMRKKRVVRSYREFQHIFVNWQLFGEYIYAGYHRHKEHHKSRNAELSLVIEKNLSTGALPAELFEGISRETDDDEQFIRFARYKVLADLRSRGLIPELGTSRLVELSSVNNDKNFNDAVRKASNGDQLGATEIELSATMLGLSEYVYAPQRQRHLARFAIPPNPRRMRDRAKKREKAALAALT